MGPPGPAFDKTPQQITGDHIMRPAWSIIIFTTLSGLGLGLGAWLASGQFRFDAPVQYLVAGAVALAISGLGLLSSTFHLGHPERAWRALSQIGTSWLSREGVLAICVMAALFGWFATGYFTSRTPMEVTPFLILLVVVTVYATSMIYASLRTVAMWHHWLTPPCFIGFAASGGLLGALALAPVIGAGHDAMLHEIALWLLGLAWFLKLLWWALAGRARHMGSLASGTGLSGHGRVRPLMPPHTEQNYLQHEMGFVVARRHATKLRIIALLVGGAAPAGLVAFAADAPPALASAAALHLAGVMVERWLFFAEAKHTVSLYYGG